MSKIARKPIPIPEGVSILLENNELTISRGNAKLSLAILPYLAVSVDDAFVTIKPISVHKQARANWGTMAALLKNALTGVSGGFTKKLELQGIGFRATMEDDTLVLNVGFTHPVKFAHVPGITITVQKNFITITGPDKRLVGEVAAQVRKIRKPEPYKGKGIRYVGEIVRRKAGKKAAGAGAEK